jgi:hypothetical protein
MLEIDWIVCRGRERAVVDGCISCPADGAGEEGRESPVQDCLDCRHLMATNLDRQPEGMCTTGDYCGNSPDGSLVPSESLSTGGWLPSQHAANPPLGVLLPVVPSTTGPMALFRRPMTEHHRDWAGPRA